MAIVASDFHGNVSKVKRFLEYKPKETHIFAGDVLDSFDLHASKQLEALMLLINSKAKLIWGNHELHYTSLNPFGRCSGYQYAMAGTFQTILDTHKHRFKNAIEADGYLITHAGLKDTLVKYEDAKKQAAWLNKNPSGIYDIGIVRGGIQARGGIFWFDHLRENRIATQFNQVFGHTASEYPLETANGITHHVCINTNDMSNRLWIFDTKLKEIMEVT